MVRLWAATRATGAEIRAGCPHSGASVCRRKRHGTMPMVPDPPAASWGRRKAVVGRRDNSAKRPRGCRAAGPLLSERRRAESRSSMASSHGVATRSMVDHGEPTAMIGAVRDRQGNRPRSSWERTWGLTDPRVNGANGRILKKD